MAKFQRQPKQEAPKGKSRFRFLFYALGAIALLYMIGLVGQQIEKESKGVSPLRKPLTSKTKTKSDYLSSFEKLNGGFYVHNLWGKDYPNYSTLIVAVDQDGSRYLSSNYYGDKIGHTSVTIIVNGKEYRSGTRLPSSDQNNQLRTGRGYWENVIYGDSPLIDVIADNYESEIKVIFNGEKRSEVILKKEDAKAILDCREFARLL